MTQQSSATSMTSHAASKGTCAKAASDHETSAQTFCRSFEGAVRCYRGFSMLSWRSTGTYTFIVPKSSTAGLQATGSRRV